jgi:hypothetical protein
MSAEGQKTSEQLSPQEVAAFQRELVDIFKAQTADENSHGAGVVRAEHFTKTTEFGAVVEHFVLRFPDTDMGGDVAELIIRQDNRWKGDRQVPTMVVEFTRTTRKHDVFEDDTYPSKGEPGTRTAWLKFQTDNRKGISGLITRMTGRKSEVNLDFAGLTLSGTATIYADSNTPKYGGKSLKSPEAIRSEIDRLVDSIKGPTAATATTPPKP